LSRMTCRTTGDSYRTWVIVGNMVSTKEVVLMKNFTKKLALLLVFAMVLGVVAPGKVAKAIAPVYKIQLDFSTLTLRLTKDTVSINNYEFTQYVGDTAPTEDKMKAIKDKDWVSVDDEAYTKDGDISWFNKKKASYAVARIYEGNAYTYVVSQKIDAQADAFKVFFTDKAEGAATQKTPAYTSAQAIGSKKTGYLVFYTGKGTSMAVVTPSVLSFRVDGTYSYNDVFDPDTAQNNLTSGGKYGSTKILNTLDRLMAKGGTLQFVQPKDSGFATTAKDPNGWATNKEVKFKYTAQKAAPSVKLGVDHQVPVKLGQEYRIVNAADSDQKSDWVSVDDYHKDGKKVKKVYLEDLVVTGSGITAGGWVADHKLTAAALATGNVKLQVRTAASSKGVASKIASTVVSMKAIDANAASTASVTYTVPYDKTKGVTVKNVSGKDIEYAVVATTTAVTSAKWKAIKKDKEAALKEKDLKDQKYVVVRVAGDKKTGILSSNWKEVALEGLTVTEQEITPTTGTGAAIAGKGSYTVTTAGAVNIEIDKAVTSGASADVEVTVEIGVSNIVKGEKLKWSDKGSNRAFTFAAPEYADGKFKIKITIKKGTKEGESGAYKCTLEGVVFTVNAKVK